MGFRKIVKGVVRGLMVRNIHPFGMCVQIEKNIRTFSEMKKNFSVKLVVEQKEPVHTCPATF